MSIRYIIGNTGSGKTTQCINEIIAKDNGDKQLIYIVPEQYTLGAEKDIVSLTPSGVIINTKICSFKKLGYELISSLGTGNKKALGEVGKLMLLHKLTLKVQDKLTFYKSSVNKQGFIDELSGTITELMQYAVTPEALSDTQLTSLAGSSEGKLKDIAQIYGMYLEYLSDNSYISQDELNDTLAALIPKSKLFDNSEIWIDGFMSFTPQEHKIIAALMTKAERINITFNLKSTDITYDNIDPLDSYADIKRSLTRLTRAAYSLDLEVEAPLLLTGDKRHTSVPELEYIHHCYFNYAAPPYDKPSPAISIVHADNKYEEASYVCSDILRLVREKHYHYNEIAIIMEGDDYKLALNRALSQHSIPNFLDSKQGLSTHPLTILITSAISIIANGWQSSDILTLLKTGLTDMAYEDVWSLEQYLTATGAGGKRFWTKGKDYMYGFSRSRGFDKGYILELRDKVAYIIAPFTDNFGKGKRHSVREICIYIYDMLYALNITDKLNGMITVCKENSDESGMRLHSQIWGILLDIFEKFNDILGDELISAKDYLRILRSAINSSTIGLIPPLQDHIIIGDISRTRLSGIKALYVIGLNDGVLPPHRTDTGLINDTDKELLSAFNIELAPNTLYKLLQDSLGIYRVLCMPREYLHLSYATGSFKGEPLTRSTVIDRIATLFTEVKAKSACPTIAHISALEPAFNKLLRELVKGRELVEPYKSLYSYVMTIQEYKQRLQHIFNLEINYDEKLNPTTAELLYTDNYNTSITQLETYAGCPMSFYLRYSLGLYDTPTYGMRYSDKGNLVHYALEELSNEIRQNYNNDWKQLASNEPLIARLTDCAVDNAAVRVDKGILFESQRYHHYLDRAKTMLGHIVLSLSNQYKYSSFQPIAYELSFGNDNDSVLNPIVIEANNHTYNITGKIDKLEAMTDNGITYLKVIDYKSSDKTINPTELYYGTQLQMLLYMDALLSYGNKLPALKDTILTPGAALYCTTNNPAINAVPKLDNDIISQYKLRGVILDIPEIYLGIDSEQQTTKTTKKYTPKGNRFLTDKPLLADDKQFRQLISYAHEKAGKILTDISKGNVSVSPYRTAHKTACDYCSYKAVCKISASVEDRFINHVNINLNGSAKEEIDKNWEKFIVKNIK
jgi:ATP-dependent helicase/nuclease subunit B